jgi:hypothetical protein
VPQTPADQDSVDVARPLRRRSPPAGCPDSVGRSVQAAQEGNRCHPRGEVILEDDLTGKLRQPGHGETITFGMDVLTNEIDLSGEHATELRETLRRYTDASRKAVTPTNSSTDSSSAKCPPESMADS